LIDLHCHILPALDDGAADLADSIAMGRQADADGIATVCATPHIRRDHPVSIAELAERIDALNREYERAGLTVRLAKGGEVAEQRVADLSAQELERLALGDGRWILVEPAPGPLSESLIDASERLSSGGFGTLIAHPERHLGPRTPELLAGLVERGALVQVTAEYLADGHPGVVKDLAERGLVHVLGSDAHSARVGRPVRLSHGYERLAAIETLSPQLEWISQTAPQAIVSGADLAPPFRCR
jgi:protein-tyrosine phosphatase